MIHLEEIARETPVATRWFTPQVLGTLWITLAVTKVMHELFHALVCRHFGGRCREMGMMFLVFAPTLYCDVSDAWMFRSRTGRILVSAAGVLAELVLAAIAVLLWTVAPPGLLRSLLMSVMVVCSVSTLFVNANPLLGFDGYFLLSDAIAIPNLAARAFGWWRDRIQGWLLDLPTDRTDSTPRERWILPTYALTSGLYRMFVSVLIVVTLSRGLFQAGLESVGGLLTWMVCLGWGVSPVAMTWRIAKDSRLRRLVDPGRLATGGLVWLCLLILALLVPLPRRVGAVCVLESAGAQSVFAGVEGEVASAIPPGTQVGKGDEILRLRDLRIELNRSRLETEEQVLQQRLIGVRLQRADQPDLAALVPVLEESLAGVRKQLALARLEAQNLVVRSPGAGRVQEAPRKPQRADSTEGEEASLETWRGSPLDSENRGCHLERGELCCQVGSDSLEATLLVNQADVDLLRVGQTVEVRTGARLQFRLTGQVVAIGQSPIAELPMELATTAAIPARPQAGRNAVPLEPHYQVRVEFEDPQIPVSRGTTGSARVKVAWASAWRQVLDLLRRTLRVDL
ncbi:MAG: hypothetical protein NT069_30920 [Planctomycetota bacterium]|nr:hypothetical protein [Planctomycetota bacterium]